MTYFSVFFKWHQRLSEECLEAHIPTTMSESSNMVIPLEPINKARQSTSGNLPLPTMGYLAKFGSPASDGVSMYWGRGNLSETLTTGYC